jgi:hypothetical protein
LAHTGRSFGLGPKPARLECIHYQEINRFVREFQSIEVVLTPEGAGEAVSVLVHAPYMQQGVTIIDRGEGFDRLPPRHQNRLRNVKAARENASAEVKEFLKGQLYGENGQERRLANGRAEMADIQRLLQDAVDRGLVPAGKSRPYPDGHDLRKWLKEYGIGVDCSAFVQQALTRLVRACCGAVGDSAAGQRGYHVGWMTSGGVYGDVTGDAGNDGRFERVPTPGEARPGDVLVRRGHIRIVANAEPAEGGAIILNVAESTSATDIPLGQAGEDPDMGPRFLQVKYPESSQPIHEQSPLRRPLSEDGFMADREERRYVLGRLKALDLFCRGHVLPEGPAAPGAPD